MSNGSEPPPILADGTIVNDNDVLLTAANVLCVHIYIHLYYIVRYTILARNHFVRWAYRFSVCRFGATSLSPCVSVCRRLNRRSPLHARSRFTIRFRVTSFPFGRHAEQSNYIYICTIRTRTQRHITWLAWVSPALSVLHPPAMNCGGLESDS